MAYPDNPSDIDALAQMFGFNPTVANVIAPNQAAPVDQVNAQPDLATTIGNIFKQYKPEHQMLDQLDQMLSNYPMRNQPTKLQNIGAILAGLGAGVHPAGISGGQPIGFVGGSPQEIMQAQDLVRYRPFYQQMEDWQNKLKPIEAGANIERYNNATERALVNNMALRAIQAPDTESKIARRGAQTEQGEEKLAQTEEQNQIRWYSAYIRDYKAQHPNLELKEDRDGYLFTRDPKTSEVKFIMDPRNPTQALRGIKVDDLTKIQAGIKGREEIARIQGQNQIGTAKVKAWQYFTTPDGRTIRANPETDEYEDVTDKLPKPQKIGPAPKTGTDVTTQTRTMMEGAAMLRPHVSDVRKMAEVLDKNNLFGPIMSRVRNYAEKIGTTGSDEDITRSLDEFATNVQRDAFLNKDRLVGEFATTLGLLASGMGRVHGGARGGGSIEMIKYLKTLLTGDSSLPMFEGRLDAVDKFLVGYAGGPKTKTDNKLDDALDKLFKKPGEE